MKKETILGIVSILMLLFLALPAVSADIDIIDIGTDYYLIGHYGFVNYQNTADFNLSGTLLVFIDGNIVAEKKLDMPIRYVAGFRCSPAKTLEFSLNETEGNHTIVAYMISQNAIVQRSYIYYADGRLVEQEEDKESEVIEEDWLKCPSDHSEDGI